MENNTLQQIAELENKIAELSSRKNNLIHNYCNKFREENKYVYAIVYDSSSPCKGICDLGYFTTYEKAENSLLTNVYPKTCSILKRESVYLLTMDILYSLDRKL